MTCVTISSDDRLVASCSQDGTFRILELMSRKIISALMEHGNPIESIYVSRDNQQIISKDWRHKVYLWKLSTGKLTESSIDDTDSARLLWKARRGWKVGQVEAESGNEKPGISVAGQRVYICEPTRNENLFEEVGQFDIVVKHWDVDINAVLWALLRDGKIAKLAMDTRNFNTLRGREDE